MRFRIERVRLPIPPFGVSVPATRAKFAFDGLVSRPLLGVGGFESDGGVADVSVKSNGRRGTGRNISGDDCDIVRLSSFPVAVSFRPRC